MAEIPCHLRYGLNERQRLVPHIAIWLPYLRGLGILVAMALLAAIKLSLWPSPLILLPLWLGKGFIIGVVDAIFFPVRPMDVIVEEQGLGFLMGGERWWLWLDAFMSIERYVDAVPLQRPRDPHPRVGRRGGCDRAHPGCRGSRQSSHEVPLTR